MKLFSEAPKYAGEAQKRERQDGINTERAGDNKFGEFTTDFMLK